MTSQALWSSAEALLATLKAKHEDPEALEPLAQKVDAIKQAAGKISELFNWQLAQIELLTISSYNIYIDLKTNLLQNMFLLALLRYSNSPAARA